MAQRVDTAFHRSAGGQRLGLPQMLHCLADRLAIPHAGRPKTLLRSAWRLGHVTRGREKVAGIVDLSGAVSRENAQALGTILLDCIAKGQHLIIAMSEVTAIDSAGAAVLVQAVAAARIRGLVVALVGVNPGVDAALGLFRLKPLFREFEDLADAERLVFGLTGGGGSGSRTAPFSTRQPGACH